MSGLIDIKEGDWVLVEHPYLYDAYVVRQVKSFTKARCVLFREAPDRDGYRAEEIRARKAIVGVFPGENAALAAAVAVRELYEEKLRSEKDIKLAFHKAAKGLLNPE